MGIFMTFKPKLATKNLAVRKIRTSTAKRMAEEGAYQHARNLVELKRLLDEFSNGANLASTPSLPAFLDGGQDAE
jgi:hypothetical protein